MEMIWVVLLLLLFQCSCLHIQITVLIMVVYTVLLWTTAVMLLPLCTLITIFSYSCIIMFFNKPFFGFYAREHTLLKSSH